MSATPCDSSCGAPRARATFLAALFVLLANDWLVKPHHLLPSCAAGKLSDVAGMIVAPVVVAILLGLLGCGRRLAAATGVAASAVIFTAIKASPGAALGWDGLLTSVARVLALPAVSHTVADPSDLLALPFLAVGAWAAWRLACDRVLVRNGVLALGTLACSATTCSYVRAAPHWGFQDARLQGTWAGRTEGGALVVRLGRASNDGSFEIGLEAVGNETPITVDLAAVAFVLGKERFAARFDGTTPSRLEAPPPASVTARVYFKTGKAAYPAGTAGSLEIPVLSGGKQTVLRVPLSFEERSVPVEEAAWRFTPADGEAR